MRKIKSILTALSLSLILAASLYAQSASPIRDLGDGFESRVIKYDDGMSVIQLHLPEAYCTLSDPINFENGVRKALVKYFGCSSFKQCQPNLIHTPQPNAHVELWIGTDVYWIYFLRYSDSDPTVVGVALDLHNSTRSN